MTRDAYGISGFGVMDQHLTGEILLIRITEFLFGMRAIFFANYCYPESFLLK